MLVAQVIAHAALRRAGGFRDVAATRSARFVSWTSPRPSSSPLSSRNLRAQAMIELAVVSGIPLRELRELDEDELATVVDVVVKRRG